MSFVRQLCGRILLILCAGLIGATAANAELKYDYQEAPNGDTRLVVSGMFSADDDLRIIDHYLKRTVISYVTFDSNGGALITALSIGRIIRHYGIPTRQTEGFRCLSSCAYAFMGGVERKAVQKSLGVHQLTFTDIASKVAADATKHVQQLNGEVMRYLHDLRLDTRIMQIALLTPPEEMHFFSAKELQELGIAEPIITMGNLGFVSHGDIGGPVPLPGAKPQ